MTSSGMLRSVALVSTNVSEERISFFIRVKRNGELGTLAVTSNRTTLLTLLLAHIISILMIEAMRSSETLVFTRATGRNMSEDDILQI
jgi:hypothetical protein